MNDSLIIFQKAALMLAEANTIQQAKELKAVCLAVEEYARQKGMGQDNTCGIFSTSVLWRSMRGRKAWGKRQSGIAGNTRFGRRGGLANC